MKDVNVLNVCGGNIEPLDDLFSPPSTLVINNTLHVDKCYFSELSPTDAEILFLKSKMADIYLNYDIFDFLEKTKLKFDIVTIYRFLEHVSFTNILYFIYLISRVVKQDGIIDVIVPDYKKLGEMLVNEDINDINYEATNILLTTELLNEPSNPHASIWTGPRLKYYWELEGRFEGIDLHPSYKFDGRKIYLRAKFKRL
jgi:hypothetical protein